MAKGQIPHARKSDRGSEREVSGREMSRVRSKYEQIIVYKRFHSGEFS